MLRRYSDFPKITKVSRFCSLIWWNHPMYGVPSTHRNVSTLNSSLYHRWIGSCREPKPGHVPIGQVYGYWPRSCSNSMREVACDPYHKLIDNKLLIWRGKRATSLLLYHDYKTHTRKESRLSSQGMANLGLNGPYYSPLVRNAVLPIKADMHQCCDSRKHWLCLWCIGTYLDRRR